MKKYYLLIWLAFFLSSCGTMTRDSPFQPVLPGPFYGTRANLENIGDTVTALSYVGPVIVIGGISLHVVTLPVDFVVDVLLFPSDLGTARY